VKVQRRAAMFRAMKTGNHLLEDLGDLGEQAGHSVQVVVGHGRTPIKPAAAATGVTAEPRPYCYMLPASHSAVRQLINSLNTNNPTSYQANHHYNSATQLVRGRRSTSAANRTVLPNLVRPNPQCIPSVQDGSISFITINAHSIAKPHAFAMLDTEARAVSPSIVCVTETWLKSKHADSLFAMDGYVCYRRDRPRKRGGGVCIYCKIPLHPKVLPLKRRVDTLELLWVRITGGVTSYCICVCYHPPKPVYSPSDLIATLQHNLLELLDSYPNDILVITGDFNRLKVTNILIEFGLEQIVTEPTRKNNILDVFITNRPELFDRHSMRSIPMAIYILPMFIFLFIFFIIHE